MVDMTQERTEPPPDGGFDPSRLREAPLLMRRSRTDRHIAGVCGGFAAYARIDPVVVRVVVAALAITGAGLVLYLAAWILVPEEGSDTAAVDGAHGNNAEDVRRIGWIVAGILAFGAVVSAGPWFDVWFPWPLVALAVLGWLWFARDRSPVGPPAGPTYAGSDAAYAASSPPTTPRPPRQRRGDGSLSMLTVGLALVTLGALWAVDRTVADLEAPAYLAAVLAVVGAGMVIGSLLGNGRRLVPLAIVVGVALLVSTQVTVWTAGEIVRTPSSSADLASSYELGAGSIRLDLTRIADLEALDGRTVHVDVGAGEVRLRVPDGVDLTVTASQVMGELRVLGQHDEGFRNDVDLAEPDTAAPDLHLVIDSGAGRVEVDRA
jgi:phage shock protein PspC (stress-responsive transcriptional regulator)